MRQSILKKGVVSLAMTLAGILVAALCMTGTSFAAAPSIEEVELHGKNKVKVEFRGDVEYRNVKVIVKDPGGRKYRAKIVRKDDDDLTFRLRKHVAGKTYRFTIKGVRTEYTDKYGKVKGSVTIPRKDTYIGKKKALDIALKDAGLKRSQVRDIHVKLDIENGVRVYEVDFERGKYEYDYDIRATDGKILKKEKELD